MYSRVQLILVLCLAMGFASVGFAQDIYINKFLRDGTLGATGNEWIEVVLAVDLTAAQLEGFYIGDSTGTTTAKFSGYKLTGMATIAASFPKGTIIVMAGGAGPAENLSYAPAWPGGDWDIILATNGTHITSNGSGGDLAGTDVVYVDTDGTNGNTTIAANGFAVNYDSTPGTFGGNANVTITAPANTTGAQLTSALSGATTPGNWFVGNGVSNPILTPGQPNGGNNTIDIDLLRAFFPVELMSFSIE